MSEPLRTTSDVVESRQPVSADLLDAYVDALQACDEGRLRQLETKHPELTEFRDCLHALDRLAPAEEIVATHSVADADHTAAESEPTLVMESTGEPQSKSDSFPNSGAPVDFGRFELLDEIGRGGMGVVYRARQKGLNRVVAIKMILANRLASPEEIRRFYGEARAAARLQHPSIVGIHEVGEVHGQHFFSMDYVEGLSLSDVLRQGPMDPEQAAQYMCEVARAVHYLHTQEVIHRDLKPSNILINGNGHPCVTDFGLAKVFSEDSEPTCTGAIIGTPSYMAPEQAAGRTSEISARTDIYGLGAVLFEMLTGRPPFREQTPLDTLVQVLEGEATLPTSLNPRIPHELELICLRCLEKDPSKRYATAAEMADDLERFLKDEPVEAQAAGYWPRLRRWSRREPALVFRLAAVLLATLIVQAKYMMSGTDFPYHMRVMVLFGTWATSAFLCQQWLNTGVLVQAARAGWSVVDFAMLTALLALAEPPVGPLLIGYPCLIAAAGLFFQVRLVLLATVTALVAFASLLTLRGAESAPPQYPLIFAAVLAVHGSIIAYQVHRVRALSRFFESRRWP